MAITEEEKEVVQQPFIESVYVASPYSIGDQEENVIRSLEAAEELIQADFIPFTPLLFHYYDKHFSHSWEEWLHICLYWVGRSDAVLRLPGESRGADMEVEYALQRGIPVFNSMLDLMNYRASVWD